jgi:hypothetical protein
LNDAFGLNEGAARLQPGLPVCYFLIKAFSEGGLTEDLNTMDVPIPHLLTDRLPHFGTKILEAVERTGVSTVYNL